MGLPTDTAKFVTAHKSLGRRGETSLLHRIGQVKDDLFPGAISHQLCQVPQQDVRIRITQIVGLTAFAAQKHMKQAADGVIDIGVGEELCSLTLQNDILSANTVQNELRRRLAVLQPHRRAVDPGQTDDDHICAVFPHIRLTQGLADALRFLISGTQRIAVDIATVVLGKILRVAAVITVNLYAGKQQEPPVSLARHVRQQIIDAEHIG